MADLVNEAQTIRGTSSLTALAVVLVVVSLTIVLGAIITEEIQSSDQVFTLTNKFVPNSTTVANASVMTLANNRIIGSSFTIYNGTGGGLHNVSIGTYNLTCSGTALCTVSLNNYSGGFEQTGNFYLNYTWNERTATVATNATDQGLNALDTMSNFLPVIAIVVVAAIIIGIIVGSFGSSI